MQDFADDSLYTKVVARRMLQMTQKLVPLTDTFPANRHGTGGDVAKVNCATCHQGAHKPLFISVSGIGQRSGTQRGRRAGRRA